MAEVTGHPANMVSSFTLPTENRHFAGKKLLVENRLDRACSPTLEFHYIECQMILLAIGKPL